MSSTTTGENALFSPLKVGDITIRNRIGMSALARNRARKTIPNEIMKEYYVQRASGGAGLIVTEGVLVSRQGTEWAHAPGIWNKEQTGEWKKLVDAVHSAGSHIYAQLWHVGRVAHPDAPEQKLAGVPVYAPSAISARGGKFRHIPGQPGYVTPTAIEDPSTIVEQFRQAAINAKEAGFDGVELHGASGYIIHQFLDSTSNQRTDKWGGSVENRTRFGLEVLQAMVDIFGRNVAIKLSPTGGFNDMGMPLQETLDTFSYFISKADQLNLAYITLVRYSLKLEAEYDGPSHSLWQRTCAGADLLILGQKRATIHDVLESYRILIKNAKTFLNADVSPEEGATLVAAGRVDGVFIGFSWITHPDLAKRIEHGKPLDNIPDIPHLQFGKDEEDMRVGYTDYPEAVY